MSAMRQSAKDTLQKISNTLAPWRRTWSTAPSLRDLAEKPQSNSDSHAEAQADQMAQNAMGTLQGETDTIAVSPLSSQSRGQPLPDPVRGVMEAGFGYDFSKVRIHADRVSAANAAALGARAYTQDRDIVFGTGQFQPQTEKGMALLVHELAHVIQQSRSRQPKMQLARLRDWQSDRSAVVTDVDIRTTNEYRAFMNPALVWQTHDHVTDAEAIQACRYILTALRNGVSINWVRDARSYLNRARTFLSGVQSLITEQETWLAGEATAAGRSTGEHIHAVAQAGGYGGGPTPWWSGMSAADQAAWLANAATVITRVITSVHGTPLEQMVAARGIVASPQECESYNAFAYYSSSDNRLHVGQHWIEIADHNPRDVHDNIAHELGGHFEYGQYGTGMSDLIMQGVLGNLPPSERAAATAGPKSVYSAYAYPETEIFAELREFDLRTPASGGDRPSTDVPRQLESIRDRFAPSVAHAIVLELRQRVLETSNISDAAKALFDTSVRTVFPGLLPPP
jgi:hypothetical protein